MIGTLESVSDDLMDMKSKVQCVINAFIPAIQDVEAAEFA